MSYVYLRSEPALWTVGHYAPSGEWVPHSDHGSEDSAEMRVRKLNGGAGDQAADEPKLPEPVARAMEFAEYMAKTAERLFDALNDEDHFREEYGPGPVLDQKTDLRCERVTALRDDIYEYRKRAAKVTAGYAAGAVDRTTRRCARCQPNSHAAHGPEHEH